VTFASYGLGVLGAFSLSMSEMPRIVAWPLALAAAVYGFLLGRREHRRPPRQVLWPADGLPTIDGRVLLGAQLQWRGPLAFLHWRDQEGHVQRLAWWPDVLSAAARRELRLAVLESPAAAPTASMAP
jgi:toxin CptA